MKTNLTTHPKAHSGHGAGAVSKLIVELLTGDKTLDYADVADRVRRRIPEAKTSPRSVACVASTLRAMGQDIPDRRSAH